MPQTPNHEYNVPNEGAQDWHEPLNENFERYDTDIEVRDEEANRGDYEPKAGAKFLATDTGAVFLGDGSAWSQMPSTGRTPEFDWIRVSTTGAFGKATMDHLGVGTFPNDRVRIRAHKESGSGPTIEGSTSSGENTAKAIDAEASSSSGNTFGIYSTCRSSEGHGVFGVNFADSGNTIGVHGRAISPDGTGVVASNNNGTALQSFGDCEISGDLDVSGNKNFVQTVGTDDGEKEVVYTATESGTPRTETSGVAELEDGRAVVDLPDHFAWVTSEAEPLHVQTTPHSSESGGLAVVERSRERIVVEDLDGAGAYEVSYTVTGTRAGHEDKQVVREPSGTSRRATDQPPSAGERHSEAD